MKKTNKYISGLMSAVMVLSLSCSAVPFSFTAAAENTAYPEEVIGDFAPVLEYDNSPMRIGETREVRISSRFVSDIKVTGITEISKNLSCEYDKNSDTFTITALAEGSAKAYVMGKDCAFGSYLHIEILPESATETTPLVMTTCLPATTTSAATTTTVIYDYATMLEYDNSPMKVGETRKVRVYNPHLSNMTVSNIYESTDNISCSYDKNSDTVTITALAEGKAKAYVMGTGCAFGAYLNIEILPENTAETSTGDANCDGKVNMGDVVLIMQSIANPDKYGLNGTDATHITSQGMLNGDMDSNGITNNDALAIQKKLLGLT